MSSSDAPDCRDLNTTECLLRAATSILAEVKKNGQQYNWDPLSFSATVVIGVVALFFAALTIGQALVAAGPGRHKCSSYALGPWAQLSKRRFEWSELRFQSIAYTPAIDLERRIRKSWPRTEGWTGASDEPRKDNWDGSLNNVFRKRMKYYPKSVNGYFPATWLNLLTRIGMDHPALWDTKAASTDYIPSDLVAAPAYSSIRDIVCLCALYSFPGRIQMIFADDSNKLVAIRGQHFDLDLRQHPALGMYAVFQTFATLNAPPRWWKEGEKFLFSGIDPLAYRIMLHAIGYVPLHAWVGNPLSVLSHVNMHSSRWVRGVTGHGNGQLQNLHDQCRCPEAPQGMSKNLPEIPVPGEAGAAWQSWCRSGSCVTQTTHIWSLLEDGSALSLLTAETPYDEPVLFPNRVEDLDSKIKTLLPFSRFWSMRMKQPQSNMAGSARLIDCEWAEENGFLFDSTKGASSDITRAVRPVFTADFSVFAIALRSAQDLLDVPNPFPFDYYALQRSLRDTMSEIKKINEWLKDNIKPSFVRCRWLSLSCASALWASFRTRIDDHNRKAQAEGKLCIKLKPRWLYPHSMTFRSHEISSMLPAVLKKIAALDSTDGPQLTGRDLLYPFRTSRTPLPGSDREQIAQALRNFAKLWKTNAATREFVYPTDEVQHPLDNLLIYRALLIHRLFSMAVDNSDIVEDEAYSKIIPIL